MIFLLTSVASWMVVFALLLGVLSSNFLEGLVTYDLHSPILNSCAEFHALLSVIMYHVTLKSLYFSFSFAVRAGAGGDEAGIWAGDLVGTNFLVLQNPLRVKAAFFFFPLADSIVKFC